MLNNALFPVSNKNNLDMAYATPPLKPEIVPQYVPLSPPAKLPINAPIPTKTKIALKSLIIISLEYLLTVVSGGGSTTLFILFALELLPGTGVVEQLPSLQLEMAGSIAGFSGVFLISSIFGGIS